MQARQAIQSLKQLKDEAQQEGPRLRETEKFSSWKGRVQSVLTRALGVDHHLTQSFIKNRYSLSVWTDGTPDSAWERAFLGGVKRANGIIDAALFELEQAGTSDDAVDETAFDPDLWAHVQVHVQHENWQAVASQTAIFVEDRVRQWCGDPKGRDGQTLVGKGLFAKILANDGQFRLGKEAGEWEGWRGIGMGFTQALGNVDRHNIQKRADAKRYAFGVLGVGSLILTQLRHQDGEDLALDE
ncbi:TIGR02391 family protein [Streptomyces sp. GC420]|uniref:TIGR02391 family protein n=1 Tax=Streptomyces sp. GC420 TaxID=2697568 RepID=UPI001414EDBD|nr:TIGR02391 family protein [Streptomyces sp. GC420]NBM14968.1 hypothetical protein [Streptomyces sp. GC420]